MLGIFNGTRADHPLADPREAKRVLEALPASDALRSLEELAHWFESVRAEASFRPEQRAQLVQLLDEAGQASARKLGREYLSALRQGKRQEARLWTAIHAFWQASALGYATCLDAYATGVKGADALKRSLPLLGVRALRAMAARLKWLHLRYGPIDQQLWTMLCRSYALLETKKLARTAVVVYPGVSGESTPELEFLRAMMFNACSPDSLLPEEIEIAERVIAHWSADLVLTLAHTSETPYWIDLAQAAPPVRMARPPQASPTVRFFGTRRGFAELDGLIGQIRKTREIPSALGLGGAYAPDTVLGVLEHLAHCCAPKLAERRHPRHRVKSRLTIAWGFDGILRVLRPGDAAAAESAAFESWIVDNVSVGGFGALVPHVSGDWLRIGCLLALQPEGGDNWLIGVIRRLSRPSLQQAAVGIQTLARSALAIELRVQTSASVSLDTETAILLDSAQLGGEVQVLLRPGAHAPGETFVLDYKGLRTMLLPTSVVERRSDYELVRCRHLIRDAA